MLKIILKSSIEDVGIHEFDLSQAPVIIERQGAFYARIGIADQRAYYVEADVLHWSPTA